MLKGRLIMSPALAVPLLAWGLMVFPSSLTAQQSRSDLSPAHLNPALPLETRVDDLVSRMTLEEKTSQLVNQARAVPRLKIPAYDWWNEALHGVARNGLATVFPEPIGLAATFDAPLIHDMAVVISTEARAKHAEAQKEGNNSIYHGLTFWSPNINIFRDPRIAETLAGANNPAGRLPMTFYKSVDQLPPFEDYSMKNRTYRYFTGDPLYAFGYGLSYSKFVDTSLKAGRTPDGGASVEATVQNSSDRDGDEVVELYLSHSPAGVPVPLRALEGFQRIHLKARESKTVRFELAREQLTIVDEKGQHVLQPSEITIFVGG